MTNCLRLTMLVAALGLGANSALAQVESGSPDGDRHGCAGRGAARRDGDGEVAGADRRAHDRDRGGRQVSIPVAAVGRVRADVRAVRLPDVQARQHHPRPRPDSRRRRPDAGRVAAGIGDRHRRIAGRRHAVDEGRHRLHDRQAGRRADRDRRLGASSARRRASGCRASTSAAATRASRPATRASASATRTASLNDGVDTPKAPAAPASTRTSSPTKKCRSSAAGGDVEMNSPGSAVVTTIKSGGNTFKGLEQPHLRAGAFVGDNIERATLERRAATPASRTCKFWEGHTDLGGPIKNDKVWFYAAYNQFKIDKQISGVPRRHRHRPRRLRQLHDQGNLEGIAERHGHRLLPAGPQAEAEPRPVGDRVAGIGAAAGQRLVDVQGRASARVEQSPVHRRQGQPVRLRLPARRQGRLQRRSRRVSTPARTSRAAPRGTRSTWRARSRRSPRRRPTTCRTGTGSHDFKFGFEYLLDISQVHDQRPRRARSVTATSTALTDRDPVRRRRRQRATSAATLDEAANDRDQRYAGYAQDRWNPNNRSRSPPACAGTTSVRTTWTASATRSSRTC